mgnify:CR=1 FL=1
MLRPRAMRHSGQRDMRGQRGVSVAAGARLRARTEVGAILFHRTAWYMCATEEVAFKPAVYASTFLRYGSGSTENKAARPISAWISVSFRVWCVC